VYLRSGLIKRKIPPISLMTEKNFLALMGAGE